MNSFEILKQLNRLADGDLSDETRHLVEQAIRHIKLQADELQQLRDDITDLKVPREDKG